MAEAAGRTASRCRRRHLGRSRRLDGERHAARGFIRRAEASLARPRRRRGAVGRASWRLGRRPPRPRRSGSTAPRAAGLGGPANRQIHAGHLRRARRVAEDAGWAGARGPRHDGLLRWPRHDVGHICRESGVGARVRFDRVPVAAAAREAARALGGDAREWAVSGGRTTSSCSRATRPPRRLIGRPAEGTGTPLHRDRTDRGDRGARSSFVDADGAPVTSAAASTLSWIAESSRS